jgi:hypothetical protein
MIDDPIPSTFAGKIVNPGVSPARVESGLPAGYRLIRKDAGSGNIIYVLQGLYLWVQGNKRGREWRDLETQDAWRPIKDNVPF